MTRLSTEHGGGSSLGRRCISVQKVFLVEPLALQQSYNLAGVTNVFLGENSLTVRCIGKRNRSFATHFSDTIFSVLSHFTPSVPIEHTLHHYTQKLHLKQKKTRAHHFHSDTFSSFYYFFTETPNFCCDILFSGRSRSVSLLFDVYTVNSRLSVKIGGIRFSSLLRGFSLFWEFLFSEMTKKLDISFF